MTFLYMWRSIFPAPFIQKTIILSSSCVLGVAVESMGCSSMLFDCNNILVDFEAMECNSTCLLLFCPRKLRIFGNLCVSLNIFEVFSSSLMNIIGTYRNYTDAEDCFGCCGHVIDISSMNMECLFIFVLSTISLKAFYHKITITIWEPRYINLIKHSIVYSCMKTFTYSPS